MVHFNHSVPKRRCKFKFHNRL